MFEQKIIELIKSEKDYKILLIKIFDTLKIDFKKTFDNIFVKYEIINNLKLELIAFIIKLCQNELDFCKHNIITFSLNNQILQKFFPGILSFYFLLITSSFNLANIDDVISVINQLISKNLYISNEGKKVMYDCLIKIDRSKLFKTSVICRDIYNDERVVFFLENLLLEDFTLKSFEYKILLNSLKWEDFKIEIARKLGFDEGVQRVVISEKLDIDLITKILYFNLCTSKSLDIDIDLVIKTKDEFTILCYYLKYDELKNIININYDVIDLIKKYSNEIEEYLFMNIDLIYKKIKKSIIYKDNLNIKIELENYEMKLDKFITMSLYLIEKDFNFSFSIVRDLLLKILIFLKIESVAFKTLQLIFNIKEKLEINLRNTFDKILYFDLDSSRIRALKYKIINNIIFLLPIKDSNFLPLLVKLWDEISITPEEEEIVDYFRLLKTVVEKSDKFYEKRFFESEIYKFLLQRFRNDKFIESDNEKYKVVIDFLKVVVKKFSLPKKIFKEIFIFCFNFVNFTEGVELIHLLILSDKYYAFYILFVEETNLHKIKKKDYLKFIKKLI